MIVPYLERINSFVVLIRLPYLFLGEGPSYVNLFLIEGKNPVLIDAGPYDRGPKSKLAAVLNRLGLSVKGISKILYTHAHPDHMGGGLQLSGIGYPSQEIYWEAARHVESYGDYLRRLRSACKRISTEHLSKHRTKKKAYERVLDTFWQPTFGKIKISKSLKDGDLIDAGGLGLEVVHTPGHSPWDICLWDKEHGMLFTGDFLLEKGTTMTGELGGVGSDLRAYVLSLERIQPYLKKTRVLLPSHGDPMISCSGLAAQVLRGIERRESMIMKELSRRECSLVDLTRLFAAPTNPLVFARQVGIVLTHLEKLIRERKITPFRERDEILFALS